MVQYTSVQSTLTFVNEGSTLPALSTIYLSTRSISELLVPKMLLSLPKMFLASIDWECMSKFSESQYKNPIISGVWSVRYVTHLLIKG